MTRSKTLLAAVASVALVTGASAQTGGLTEVSEGDASKYTFPAGWTYDELEEADVIGADDDELGEVEAILADGSNQVTAVVVDVEDDDKEVVLQLSDVQASGEGDEKDIKVSMTAEQLAGLPEHE
ncbi:PRC-barrel domain-containing protein [Chthonobacter rhizosphaerae]|uniref:PRC-barrel domain-containing protein n=1 Tax=Chthonobacter rhizosphaerae TaxID=2735553 RepID=UPI0015EEFAE1|nr:PRC-barrel domain-containing protein [Chthonobacter rhizosphaerae]